MMRTPFIACFLLASFAAAAAEWPADPDADPCDAGSARGQGECARRELDRQTRGMLAAYAELMASLPPDHDEYEARSRLEKSQTAWVEFRDASCGFEGGISGGVTLWQSARSIACEARATGKRAEVLRAYLACAREAGDDPCGTLQ